MHRSVTNVLFVSEANGCRSLLAEACLNHLGKGKFKAFSCGEPAKISREPQNWTLLALKTAGIPSQGLRCKAWTEFTNNRAPKMDFVISLDAHSYDEHPSWPGQPVTALWDYPNVQTAANGSLDADVLAVKTLVSLRHRIELLVNLHSKAAKRNDLLNDLRDMRHM